MQYSEEVLKFKLDEQLKRASGELYKANFIQYKGKTAGDKKDQISISDFLASQIDLGKIDVPNLVRQKPYKQKNHAGILPKRAKPGAKNEKRFAIALYNRNTKLGSFKLLDYQIPLKAKKTDDHRGEIDLLALDEANHLCLIELKPPESKETLLRAVLEIHTYFLNVIKNKEGAVLKEEYGLPRANLRKIVLVGKHSHAGKTAINLKKEHEQQVALCKAAQVEIFVYDAKNLDQLEFKPNGSGLFRPEWNVEIPIELVFPN